MRSIYTLGIKLYGQTIRLASLFSDKAKKWVDGRKDWQSELKVFEKTERQKRIWFHTASLGEFEQARPVMESLKQRNAEIEILLTFYSPSGYEIQKEYDFADKVMYMPLDTTSNAQLFLDLAKPDYIVFVKYEFWFNFFNEIGKRNIPFSMISVLFREHQSFFKWYGAWSRRQLKSVSWFFVQDEYSKLLLEQHNIKNASIAGDTRFDRVIEVATRSLKFPSIENWVENKRVLVSGSSWEKEDEYLMRIIENIASEEWLFVVAPHEIKEAKIKAWEEKFGNQVKRFSQVKEVIEKNTRVLIIDSIGKLMHLYQFGDIALIGGGFHDGIHNTLEPAVFGMPVIFGPKYKKYIEAVELIRNGGGKSFNSYEEFQQLLMLWFEDSEELDKRKQDAQEFVQMNKGAAHTICEEGYIKGLLPE